MTIREAMSTKKCEAIKMAYCEFCGKEVKTKIITKKETFWVRFEDVFEINAKVMVCAECGEEIFNEKLDTETLISVYDKYKKKHNLLLSKEIKKIRKQYGLDQRDFAKLLHWDNKSIRRYENGAIQTRKQNNLLLFLRKPKNMRTYLSEHETALTEKQVAKLLDTADKLMRDSGS